MGKQILEQAKSLFLAEAGDEDWLQAVGIGLVEDELGLVISVKPGKEPAARRILQRLDVEVPVSIRAIEEIRARDTEVTSDSQSIDFLRRSARKRLGD